MALEYHITTLRRLTSQVRGHVSGWPLLFPHAHSPQRSYCVQGRSPSSLRTARDPTSHIHLLSPLAHSQERECLPTASRCSVPRVWQTRLSDHLPSRRQRPRRGRKLHDRLGKGDRRRELHRRCGQAEPRNLREWVSGLVKV